MLRLFCSVSFSPFVFIEAAALRSFNRSSFFDMHAPTSTHSYPTTVCVFFVFKEKSERIYRPSEHLPVRREKFETVILLFIWSCLYFPSIFVPFPFSLCMESTSYVFPFRMVFFYLVTTGWIFDITLMWEFNPTNPSIGNIFAST